MDIPQSYQAIVVLILLIWSTVWKGFALWKSGRRGQKVWFIVILVLNTAGILEIIYLLINKNKKELSSDNKKLD